MINKKICIKLLILVCTLVMVCGMLSMSFAAQNGHITIAKNKNNCGFNYYYSVDFYDVEGNLMQGYHDEDSWRHSDTDIRIPADSQSMTLKVGAHCGSSYVLRDIPTHVGGNIINGQITLSGLLGSSAKMEWDILGYGKGKHSIY